MECELPSSGDQPANALDPRAPGVVASLHYDTESFEELLEAVESGLLVGHVQIAYVARIEKIQHDVDERARFVSVTDYVSY